MCILEILVFLKIKEVPLLTFYKHYGYNEQCNIIIMSCYPKTKNATDRNRHTKSIYPVVFLYTLIQYTCSISSFHGMLRFQCISKKHCTGKKYATSTDNIAGNGEPSECNKMLMSLLHNPMVQHTLCITGRTVDNFRMVYS